MNSHFETRADVFEIDIVSVKLLIFSNYVSSFCFNIFCISKMFLNTPKQVLRAKVHFGMNFFNIVNDKLLGGGGGGGGKKNQFADSGNILVASRIHLL